jgi:hypothetical protein
MPNRVARLVNRGEYRSDVWLRRAVEISPQLILIQRVLEEGGAPLRKRLLGRNPRDKTLEIGEAERAQRHLRSLHDRIVIPGSGPNDVPYIVQDGRGNARPANRQCPSYDRNVKPIFLQELRGAGAPIRCFTNGASTWTKSWPTRHCRLRYRKGGWECGID